MMGTLSDLMEFDHVIRVNADGTVTDALADAPWAPSLYVDDDGAETFDTGGHPWELLTGHTGQCGYSGPVMHPSEYIGGGLERAILSRPGLYVAIVADCYPTDTDPDPEPAGWAVAYMDA
jgi:hypothetical protein